MGQEARDRRLTAARRAPQDHRGELPARDHPADRPLQAEQVVLADDVGEPARPQPVGQRVRRLFLEKRGHALFVTLAKARVQNDRPRPGLVEPRLRGCGRIVEMNPAPLTPSFPRKRESKDFSRLPWAPAFAGATTWWTGGISSHAHSRE